VFGAGYSIAKHVFLNKNACSKLLGGIDEIEEEMGDDMANRFKGKYGQYFGLYDGSPKRVTSKHPFMPSFSPF